MTPLVRPATWPVVKLAKSAVWMAAIWPLLMAASWPLPSAWICEVVKDSTWLVLKLAT